MVVRLIFEAIVSKEFTAAHSKCLEGFSFFVFIAK